MSCLAVFSNNEKFRIQVNYVISQPKFNLSEIRYPKIKEKSKRLPKNKTYVHGNVHSGGAVNGTNLDF